MISRQQFLNVVLFNRWAALIFCLSMFPGALRGEAAEKNPRPAPIDARVEFAYIASSDSVYQYRVTAERKLIPLSPLIVPLSVLPGYQVGVVSITFDPYKKFAYVVYDQVQVNAHYSFTPDQKPKLNVKPILSQKNIAQFRVSLDGQLRPLKPANVLVTKDFQLNRVGLRLALEPKGKFAYLLNGSAMQDDSGATPRYCINRDGTLTSLPPVTIAPHTGNALVRFVSTGRFAYATDQNDFSSRPDPVKYHLPDQHLFEYSIDDNGVFVPLSASDKDMGFSTLSDLWLAPDGRYAYFVSTHQVGDGDKYLTTVTPFRIGTDGEFSQITPAAFEFENTSGFTFDEARRHIYTFHDNSISMYAVAPDGTLNLNPLSTVPADFGASKLRFNAGGEFAYVINDQSISQYRVTANGALESLSPPFVSLKAYPSDLVIDPQNRVGCFGNLQNERVSYFQISESGKLSGPYPIPWPSQSGPISIDFVLK